MKENTGIFILIVLYFVGTLAMLLPSIRPMVLPLSSFTLFCSFLVLLQSYRWKKEIVLASALVFLVGFGAEWVGVTSGKLFGNYWYGNNLGTKLFGVPLIIGINWAMLSLLCSAISIRWIKHPFIQLLAAAAIMTGLDWIMEPVAIKNDFWHWKNNHIPLFNFACWFGISCITNWVYISIAKPKVNKTSLTLFLLITLFFTIQFIR